MRNWEAQENRFQVTLRHVQARLACRVREILGYDVIQKLAIGYDCVTREGNIYGKTDLFSVSQSFVNQSVNDVHTGIIFKIMMGD